MPFASLACISTLLLLFSSLHASSSAASVGRALLPGQCRSQPGDSTFPSTSQWAALNASVDGRLVTAVPTAKLCQNNGCTAEDWQSSIWRAALPGAMNSNNWEQDYAGNSSMCLLTVNTTTCNQGRVPLFAINATTPAHLQAGVRFAAQHNLRVAIKASGHDFLGRSTAKDSLLLWTQYFKQKTFSDNYRIGNKSYGSTVTVGSGVGLRDLYGAAKVEGKIFVGGTAYTVVAAGGYSQGGGHSAFSPILGLAVDNAVQYNIVLANGEYVEANEFSHPDLFWALRGGGAGSWGVITSVTYKTFDIFQATIHQTVIRTNTSTMSGQLMAAHARHIFDLDDLHAGQYFYLSGTPTNSSLSLSTLVKGVSGSTLIARMKPFLDDARALGAEVLPEITVTATPNEIIATADFGIESVVAGAAATAPGEVLPFQDDVSGQNLILGSRLIPDAAYRGNVDHFGTAVTEILKSGVPGFLGHMVSGGKVAENANLSVALTPKWRTAKTHMLLSQTWLDSTPPALVEQIRHNFTFNSMPLLINLTGESDSGAYSSEADVLEPNYQTTFFGPNYPRLSTIKSKYDPNDLFIVGAGVGSERWDAAGMCRK
ncbi:FAD-binding domain-containing protein [Auriscalpium vulgare]|uniref:FAD-binding domain-containing protein n=1 Tax=Auriscalpium vulgare TaxID=40419 RepID=A0ACB8R826_9AGAM|nr:FAD-binding domain-containing protein [Auriscalpium vulgare]